MRTRRDATQPVGAVPCEPEDVPPGGGPSGDGGGEEGGPRRGWPLGLAVLATVALAALLTYVGMLTQIWANLAGSQLPGA